MSEHIDPLDQPDLDEAQDPHFYSDLGANVTAAAAGGLEIPQFKDQQKAIAEGRPGVTPELAIPITQAELNLLRESSDPTIRSDFIRLHGIESGWSAWLMVDGRKTPIQIDTTAEHFGALKSAHQLSQNENA